jgi:hypothetical protein
MKARRTSLVVDDGCWHGKIFARSRLHLKFMCLASGLNLYIIHYSETASRESGHFEFILGFQLGRTLYREQGSSRLKTKRLLHTAQQHL